MQQRTSRCTNNIIKNEQQYYLIFDKISKMCKTQFQLYPTTTQMTTIKGKLPHYRTFPKGQKKLRSGKKESFFLKAFAVSIVFFGSVSFFQHSKAVSLSTLSRDNKVTTLDQFAYLGAQDEKPRIPHHIVLLDSRYDSFFDVPSPLQENMQHTIETYLHYWDDASIITSGNYASHYDKMKAMVESPFVWYLNNTECENSILGVAPDLLPFYRNETKGQNKANICRITALYLRGGYYFDTDMQIVKAVPIEPHITFMTPWEKRHKKYKGLFNSFIAVAPEHPLLKVNIELMRNFYIKKNVKFHLLGTGSLYHSFIKFYNLSVENATAMRDGKLVLSDDERMGHYSESSLIVPTGESKDWPVQMFLGEIHLDDYLDQYASFPRHDNTRRDRCAYVVHDFVEKEIYFYSRISGVPNCRLLNNIPRRAIFIDPTLATMKELPPYLILNMKHTAEVYSNFWDATYNTTDEDEQMKKREYEELLEDKGAFLGDMECRKIVGKVEPRLLRHYKNEENINQKTKLCRLSYLFEKGGYYFDTDIQVISPVIPENEHASYIQPLAKSSTNSSSENVVRLVDSFMAVAAKHPLIRIQLENLVQFYTKREETDVFNNDVEDLMVVSHRGLQIQGEESVILAIKEFYGREGKGINVKNWDVDFSLHQMEVDLGGIKGLSDVIGRTKNPSDIFFYSNIL